jgi:hypothetical protein
MIAEIQRKLDIEDRVKEGTQRMIEATETQSQPETRKTKMDLDVKMIECIAKIYILQKALFQYQGLELLKSDQQGLNYHIGIYTLETLRFPSSKRTPLNAILTINVNSITAIQGKKSSKTELFVVVRVDNAPKAFTRHSKSNWNEDLILSLEKAHEIEIVLTETDGTVLGIVWFQLSDFIDELNRLDPHFDEIPINPRTMSLWLDLIPGGKINVSLSLGTVLFLFISHMCSI